MIYFDCFQNQVASIVINYHVILTMLMISVVLIYGSFTIIYNYCHELHVFMFKRQCLLLPKIQFKSKSIAVIPSSVPCSFLTAVFGFRFRFDLFEFCTYLMMFGGSLTIMLRELSYRLIHG